MRWLLLIPFALIASAKGPSYELQRQLNERGEKVCKALEPIYKTGRIRIDDGTGVMLWCNFTPPYLPLPQELDDCPVERRGPVLGYDSFGRPLYRGICDDASIDVRPHR